jgi:hypothetical protein
LKVPTGAIRDVIDSCKALNDQDFRKDRNLPDRQWAEICYMKWWLTPRQDAGKDVSFFTEESFGFRGLIADFEDTGWRMERWKSGEADRLSATGFPNSVRELHEKFSRLIACYLIYRNASKQDLYEEAKDFGIDMGISPPVNPLHYWIVYVIALAVSVYVGVHASAFIYDWLFAVPPSAENSDRAMRWMMYSLSNYGLAIMGILLLRFATGSGKAGLLQSHLIIYCWTFAVGYVLGPFGLALAVHKFGTGSYPTMDLYLVYYKMLKWGLGPALVCVYISYYLDRQTCDDLPDIVHSSATVGWRLLNCFGFAAITVFLLLPELLSLVAQGEKPAWETGKLRFVATGTTFFVVFGLALAAQFALRKGMESSGAVFSPPANRMEPAG